MAHVEYFQVRHSKSVLIVSIDLQLSLFLFGLLSPLWCFSNLVNYYLEPFFQFEGDFALRKNDLKYCDIYSSFNSQSTDNFLNVVSKRRTRSSISYKYKLPYKVFKAIGLSLNIVLPGILHLSTSLLFLTSTDNR